MQTIVKPTPERIEQFIANLRESLLRDPESVLIRQFNSIKTDFVDGVPVEARFMGTTYKIDIGSPGLRVEVGGDEPVAVPVREEPAPGTWNVKAI